MGSYVRDIFVISGGIIMEVYEVHGYHIIIDLGIFAWDTD